MGQVDDHPLLNAVDGGVRLVDEALQTFGKPMIAPGLAAIAVHALLDHGPMPVIGDNEAVEIEVEPVLDGGTVDLGDEPARLGERRAVDADPIPDHQEFLRRLARMPAAPATDMDAELSRQRCQAALQSADDAGGDP